MNYSVVFDAADNFVPARFPFLIGFAVAILGACVIGAILLRQESQRRALTGDRPRVRVVGLLVALLVVVMASAIVVALTALSSPSQEETARAIESSPVVEGLIEHFHPMPSGGHDTERFDVAGVHFEYSHWNMSQGFNQDVTAGGPIREGLYVRIHYVSIDRPSFATGLSYGTIVRLEIRRESHTFESDEVERSGLARLYARTDTGFERKRAAEKRPNENSEAGSRAIPTYIVRLGSALIACPRNVNKRSASSDRWPSGRGWRPAEIANASGSTIAKSGRTTALVD